MRYIPLENHPADSRVKILDEDICQTLNGRMGTGGPNEELVQDMISILQVFSCRLYGLRKYKNQIKEDEELAQELQNRTPSNAGTEN